MDILNVKDLVFSYEDKTIINKVSFNLNKGEVFCILGPNGCGKSTLIDCILGFNKIQEGNIFIEGKDIRTYKESKLAQKISYVPQNHNKTFPYKVIDVVIMGRTYKTRLFSSPTKNDKLIALDALRQVGMDKLSDKIYTNLSGGELQLIMIARALVQDTPIIVMDEPTSHLDFYHENKVLSIVGKLIKEKKISVLMATHFLNHPFYFENLGIHTTVGIMNNCKIKYIGKPSEILTEDNLEDSYKIHAKINSFNHNDKVFKHVVCISN